MRMDDILKSSQDDNLHKELEEDMEVSVIDEVAHASLERRRPQPKEDRTSSANDG